MDPRALGTSSLWAFARRSVVALSAAATVALLAASSNDAEARSGRCPSGMALVDDAFCVDRWEASLVEVGPRGVTTPFSPYESVKGHAVRAVTRANVVPQAYISRNEAELACEAASKRLCTEGEWVHACKGRRPTTFPYGADRKPGYCNDSGVSPLAVLYGATIESFSFEPMNDPRLNHVAGTVTRTGSHRHCTNGYGAFDMVGNVHEWVADPEGTFRGGYFLDTHLNGDGCDYRTIAHGPDYHDYSTGFRCCADPR